MRRYLMAAIRHSPQLTRDPAVGAPDRKLTVWGPLYATPPGGGGEVMREVRRLRLGAAHKTLDDADRRWAAAAAMVALCHQ